jgi:hypothetical protein
MLALEFRHASSLAMYNNALPKKITPAGSKGSVN